MKKYLDMVRALLWPAAVIVVLAGIGGWRPDLVYWNAGLWKDLWIWGAAFALVTLLLAPLKTHRALLLAGVTLLYLGVGVGAAQACAVSAFALASYALGRWLLHAFYRRQRGQTLLVESLLTGMGAYTALFALMIHYPVNYRLVYSALLALPVLAWLWLSGTPGGGWPAGLARGAGALSGRVRRIGYWQLAGALCVIGYMARYAFYPTLSYDDNALHLRIWTTLAHNHVYDFDVRSQVWAVAPFVVDLLLAIPSVLAGANARGAANLALLLFLLYSMWQLARLLLRSPAQRLLLLVLFVSTPLTALLLAGQQTELMLSVVATSATLVALRRSSALDRPALAALLMAAALCCGIKMNGAPLGLTVLAVWACRLHWRQAGAQLRRPQFPWAGLIVVLLLASFVAFQAYAYAWYSTGNPVLPLYNGIFKSPMFPPETFIDPTYTKGASLRAYWEMFFRSNLHQESANYIGGFQYGVLLPLALLMLPWARRRGRAALMLLPLLGFGLLMFLTLQYLRYLYPVMPLASVLIGALLADAGARRGAVAARLTGGVVVLLFAAANVFFSPGIIWFFSTPLRTLYTEAGRLKLVKEKVPEQFMNQYLNLHAPGAVVLFEPARPYGASLAALPAYVNWYASWRQLDSWQVSNEQEMAAFLARDRVAYVYWDFAEAQDEQHYAYRYRKVLREYLSQFGVPEMQVGNMVMYRLQPRRLKYRPALDVSDFSALDQKNAGAAVAGMAATAVAAGEAPLVAGQFALDGARAIRYTVQLDCPAGRGNFLAQINWDHGAPYFHSLPCFHRGDRFTESYPVPAGATTGTVFIMRQAGGPVVVNRIQVELH